MADPSWLAQVKAVFDNAGVPPEVWVPIMLHESNANPGAVNDTRGQTTRPGTVPEYSIGLFQINVAAKFPNDTAKQEALAAQLKDPVTNATYAAQAMAGAWSAVQAAGLNLSQPVTDWPWLVGIRSGWPGGSVANPCTSDYCNSLKAGFGGVAQRWANAVNSTSNKAGDLIAPYFGPSGPPSGGGTVINAGATGPTGQGGGTGPGGALGGLIGGAQQAGQAAAGAGEFLANPKQWASDVIQSARDTLRTDFSGWVQSDAAKSTLFFVTGFLLVLIGVFSILFEQQAKVAPAVIKTTRNVAEA